MVPSVAHKSVNLFYGHKNVEKVEKEKILERGSIIRLEELNSSTKYVITAVFKVYGRK